MEKLQGFYKIKSEGGSLQTSIFYNPENKEIKRIITDDLEYQYGDGLVDRNFTLSEREIISSMEINESILLQYKIDNGIFYVGAKVEVTKGRKYKKGIQDIIIKLYDYNDKYGRFIAVYCITENGMKINTENLKII